MLFSGSPRYLSLASYASSLYLRWPLKQSVYNSDIYFKKITFQPMSHFFYKNNSEMSWVQQQIAPLLNLNINIMISLYSRNLDPFFYHYIVLVVYSKLRCREISKNIPFYVIQNVNIAPLVLMSHPFRHKCKKKKQNNLSFICIYIYI